MSTRIYCDQCGTETSKRKALRFSLSGYSANRTSMGQLNDIEIDICQAQLDATLQGNNPLIQTTSIKERCLTEVLEAYESMEGTR